MARITIVIDDLPQGRGFTVQTDAGAPALGQQHTPAQLFGNTLLRLCIMQAEETQFGTAAASLAGELLNCQEQ